MKFMSRRLLYIAIVLLACAPRAWAQPWGDVANYFVGGWVSNVNTLTVGPDGAIWFTFGRCDDPFCTTTVHEFIGRITEEGTITEFPLPFSSGPYGRGVYGITTGPDSALWYTEIEGGRIGRMTTTGIVTSFALPAPHSHPYLITPGPDGALWFTLPHAIGRITTGGEISTFPIPTAYSSDPTAITTGPDGALWFTELNGNRLGRVTTHGNATSFALPDHCNPFGITSGHDDALWFACSGSNAIGRISLDGAVSTYQIPTPASVPIYMTTSPDGAIWFSEQEGLNIGVITPDGVMTEYPVSIGRLAHHIVWGPGGIWLGNGAFVGHLMMRDVTAPTIVGMPASGCSIWPPNHKLRRVARISAMDESGINVLTVTVTSSEPQLPGPPDTVVTPDGSGGFVVQLRAERQPHGPGRIYTIVATVQDNAGNVAEAVSSCTVPRDARR